MSAPLDSGRIESETEIRKVARLVAAVTNYLRRNSWNHDAACNLYSVPPGDCDCGLHAMKEALDDVLSDEQGTGETFTEGT